MAVCGRRWLCHALMMMCMSLPIMGWEHTLTDTALHAYAARLQGLIRHRDCTGLSLEYTNSRGKSRMGGMDVCNHQVAASADAPATLPVSPTTIADLPHDFLRHVFALLGVRDLCACACTCKAWNELTVAPAGWQPRVLRRWAHGRDQRWAVLGEQQQWKQLYKERHLVSICAGDVHGGPSQRSRPLRPCGMSHVRGGLKRSV